MPRNHSRSPRYRRLVAWFASRGYTLVPAKEYAVIREGKQGACVYYRPGDSLDTLLTGLLHEAGHVLLFDTIDKDDTMRYMGRYAPGPLSKAKAASVVDEEREAWWRGARLAKRLGLTLPSAYWRTAGDCTYGYMLGLTPRAPKRRRKAPRR